MDKRPIGVLDSGVGGLSAVRVLRALLPGEDILFFADTANVPYGTRSRDEIAELSTAGARLLQNRGVKAILVACGTISANGLGAIAGAVPIPVCGVIEPAAELAVESTDSRAVGVLSTEATMRAGAFPAAIHAIDPGIRVTAHAAGKLVPLAEAGRVSYADAEVRRAVDEALAPFSGSGIDTLVLGCTHFPLLIGAFAEATGGLITLIDSGEAGARECLRMLETGSLLSGKSTGGTLTCLVSGDPRLFERTAGRFLPANSFTVRKESA